MSFTAPTLVTSIDGNSYATQINSNFNQIQNSFNSIQTYLNAQSIADASSFRSALNMAHLPRLCDKSGVLGEDSFTPSFTLATGVATLTISPPSTGAKTSHAIFVEASLGGSNGVGDFPRWFNNDTAFTSDLTAIVTVDGTYDMMVGAYGVGAPNMYFTVVEESYSPDQTLGTDYDALSNFDLPLYQFTLTKSGTTYSVKDLRRLCDVIVTQETFTNSYEKPFALTTVFPDPLAWGESSGGSWKEAMNTEGYIPTVGGLIVPWDCQVVGAYVHVDTIGSQTFTDGVSLHLFEGSHRQIVVLGSEYGTPEGHDVEPVVTGPVYLDDSGATQFMSPRLSDYGYDEPKILTAGTFVQPAIGPFENVGLTDPPTGLSITLLIKPHYLTIYN